MCNATQSQTLGGLVADPLSTFHLLRTYGRLVGPVDLAQYYNHLAPNRNEFPTTEESSRNALPTPIPLQHNAVTCGHTMPEPDRKSTRTNDVPSPYLRYTLPAVLSSPPRTVSSTCPATTASLPAPMQQSTVLPPMIYAMPSAYIHLQQHSQHRRHPTEQHYAHQQHSQQMFAPLSISHAPFDTSMEAASTTTNSNTTNDAFMDSPTTTTSSVDSCPASSGTSAATASVAAATTAYKSLLAARRQRGEKRPIPLDQKDDKYFERRRRNNEAAKKSRDARKMREDRIAFRAAVLDQENAILRTQIMALRDEVVTLRQMICAQQSATKVEKSAAQTTMNN